MIDRDAAFVGMRVRVPYEGRFKLGHISKIGRKYVWVYVYGQLQKFLPEQLDLPGADFA